MIGTVRKWSDNGDFGFVAVQALSELVFLHKNMVCNGMPAVGDRIDFDGVERSSRGLRCCGWAAILLPAAEDGTEGGSDGNR